MLSGRRPSSPFIARSLRYLSIATAASALSNESATSACFVALMALYHITKSASSGESLYNSCRKILSIRAYFRSLRSVIAISPLQISSSLPKLASFPVDFSLLCCVHMRHRNYRQSCGANIILRYEPKSVCHSRVHHLEPKF